MRPRPTLRAILVSTIATTAVAQDASETRDRRPIVQVTGIGEGDPVVLRWRPASGQTSTVQISTRTVPSELERPGIDDLDPEVVLTGFTRPPIEKMWTIDGRVVRQNESSEAPTKVRWRVLDAVARLVGIEETRTATTPPVEAESAPSTEAPPSSTQENDAVARAIRLEGVINAGLEGTKGAAITQIFGGAGIAHAGTSMRLEDASRRAQFEGDVLRHALELIEIQLPAEPIGVGGTWTSRWTRIQNGIEVEVVVDATLRSVDDGDPVAGRVARSAEVQIEYRRRATDPEEAPRAADLAEADGRGRVRLALDTPLRLDARLVETPPGIAAPGTMRPVTRIRATTIR